MTFLAGNTPRIAVFTPHFCRPAVEGAWKAIAENGLLNLCTPALQINAGHVEIPDPRSDLRVPKMFAKHEHDWIPGAASLLMYDCEPRRPEDWVWKIRRNGATDTDLALAWRMTGEAQREKASRSMTAPLGLWGFPHTDKNPVSGTADDRHLDDAVLLNALCDCIIVEFYPASRAGASATVGPHNEATHRARVRTTIEGLRARTDKPLVPILWLHPSHDNAAWFRVYLDELANLGVSAIALWGDCQTVANGRNVERAIGQVVPAIGSWARKVHLGGGA